MHHSSSKWRKICRPSSLVVQSLLNEQVSQVPAFAR
jgi:hypothetical protein